MTGDPPCGLLSESTACAAASAETPDLRPAACHFESCAHGRATVVASAELDAERSHRRPKHRIAVGFILREEAHRRAAAEAVRLDVQQHHVSILYAIRVRLKALRAGAGAGAD